jgi:predicted restriction endonuclease
MDTIQIICHTFNESKNINDISYNDNNQKLLIEFCLEFMYDINLNDYFTEKNIKRIGQGKFRDQLLKRFNSKCIIDPIYFDTEDDCEACHIIPVNEFNDYNIDNGILLGNKFHKRFDKYELSINPETYKLELKSDINSESIKQIEGMIIEQLKNFPGIKYYLTKHYEKFKNQ